MGEYSLLYKVSRTASAYCPCETFLWGIDRASFKKAIRDNIERNHEKRKEYMESCPLMKLFNQKQKDEIMNSMIEVIFNDPINIDVYNRNFCSFYIVTKGTANIKEEGSESSQIKEGDIIGENYLTQKDMIVESHPLTICPKGELICLALTKAKAEKILGKNIRLTILKNKLESTLEKLIFWSQINSLHRSMLINSFEFLCYSKGKCVFEKNSPIHSFFVVVEGCLEEVLLFLI